MPKPDFKFDKQLKRIPTHSRPLPDEARVPHRHYRRSANDAGNLLKYVDRNLNQQMADRATYESHIRQLSTMVLLGIVEAFERFLKEVAAACINHVASLVIDDRLDVFNVKGNVAAAHFAEASLGKALCESLTWCDCDEANRRIRRILADPFDAGSFYIFPLPNQNPNALRGRYELVSLIWQLRHTIAHNSGVITSSDAHKLRLLTRSNIHSPRLLWPTKGDVWCVKLYLDETVELINREVANRLGELLTKIHEDDASLFEPQQKARELAELFEIPATVAGITCQPT
jgi:hypothetical protein